jgi:hypothetical protein
MARLGSQVCLFHLEPLDKKVQCKQHKHIQIRTVLNAVEGVSGISMINFAFKLYWSSVGPGTSPFNFVQESSLFWSNELGVVCFDTIAKKT